MASVDMPKRFAISLLPSPCVTNSSISSRTYFTGVLPITLDDLSSGFNVGTIVNLNPELLNFVGFTEAQVERYVDDVYAEYGLDRSNRADVLVDLKAFYDGYRFLPDAEPHLAA